MDRKTTYEAFTDINTEVLSPVEPSVKLNTRGAKDIIEFFKILDSIADTYESKNNDYGSAIEIGMSEQGFSYINAILLNKTMRLASLTSPGATQKVKSESLSDTLLDIAVYCIEASRVLDKVKRGEELQKRKEFNWSSFMQSK